MQLTTLVLALAISADPTPPPAARIVRGQDAMPGMDMGGMNMGGMGGMAMTPGDMAMGRMGFMNVMGSRADPGLITKLLRGFEPPMAGMGGMNGMSMLGMGAMPGMNMDKTPTDVAAERAKLSLEDRALVEAQEVCPISGMRLGAMGAPIKLVLNGQTVFVCCEHCVEKAKAEPEKTLAEVARSKERKAAGSDMAGMGAMPGMAMGGMNGMGSMGGMNHERFSLSGWTNMSFTASTAADTNLPIGFNYQANRFLLQQNWLRLDYAVDENATRPSFGFRSDWILPGTDYRFTLPRGLLNDQLTANGGTPNMYGIDPIQFYGEVYLPYVLNGFYLKVGRFCMLNGTEMNEATMNLLPSHSYTYLADPFTHTGILTTTRLTKQLLVQAGIATGSDNFFGATAEPTFVGGIKWFSDNDRTNVAFITVLGSGTFNVAETFDNRNLFDVVLRHQFFERLYYSIEGLYGYENNVPGMGFVQWYGLVQNLTYQVSPKLAPTVRVELFDDVQGERTFFTGVYTAVSAGIWYRPKHWLTFRQEFRYDHNESGPFEGKQNLFTATSDLILQW